MKEKTNTSLGSDEKIHASVDIPTASRVPDDGDVTVEASPAHSQHHDQVILRPHVHTY